MIPNSIVFVTTFRPNLIASSTEWPLANALVIADESVSPVPWVRFVSIRSLSKKIAFDFLTVQNHELAFYHHDHP